MYLPIRPADQIVYREASIRDMSVRGWREKPFEAQSRRGRASVGVGKIEVGGVPDS